MHFLALLMRHEFFIFFGNSIAERVSIYIGLKCPEEANCTTPFQYLGLIFCSYVRERSASSNEAKIDQFTVVYLVTWPLCEKEPGLTLSCKKPSFSLYVTKLTPEFWLFLA